jgi:hypothetical protein
VSTGVESRSRLVRVSDALNDTFTAACAMYVSAVTLNDAALVLRSSDAPANAVALANSLTTAAAVSAARGALYEVLLADGWTAPEKVTLGMMQDQRLLREGTGTIEA